MNAARGYSPRSSNCPGDRPLFFEDGASHSGLKSGDIFDVSLISEQFCRRNLSFQRIDEFNELFENEKITWNCN